MTEQAVQVDIKTIIAVGVALFAGYFANQKEQTITNSDQRIDVTRLSAKIDAVLSLAEDNRESSKRMRSTIDSLNSRPLLTRVEIRDLFNDAISPIDMRLSVVEQKQNSRTSLLETARENDLKTALELQGVITGFEVLERRMSAVEETR